MPLELLVGLIVFAIVLGLRIAFAKRPEPSLKRTPAYWKLVKVLLAAAVAWFAISQNLTKMAAIDYDPPAQSR